MTASHEPAESSSPADLLAQELLSVALRHVRDAEVHVQSEDILTVGHRDRDSLGSHQVQRHSFAVRVLAGGRIGFAVSQGEPQALDLSALLQEAIRAAETGPPAPATFYKGRDPLPEVLIADDAVVGLQGGLLQHLAHTASSRVVDLVGEVPRQFALRRVLRHATLYTRTLERRAFKTLYQFGARIGPLPSGIRFAESQIACRFPDDPLATGLGSLLWKLHLAQTAHPCLPDQTQLVLGPQAVVTLLGWACQALCGSAIVDKSSPLLPYDGGLRFDPRLHLADDPCTPWAAGSGRFDGEGVPRARNALIEAGKPVGLLLDLGTASQLALQPTGSTVRGFETPPVATPSHLVVGEGRGSFDDLLRASEGGAYIDTLDDDSPPDAQGDFSLRLDNALAIVDGRPRGVLPPLRWSGNLFDLLRHHVRGLGADRCTVPGGHASSLVLGDVSLAPAEPAEDA